MTIPDPLAGLLAMVRQEAAAAATEAVRAELLRQRQASTSGPRLLSFTGLAKRYGLGRIEAQRLIAAGKLPAIERRGRGGRLCTFVAIEDAEAVLAGRSSH